jgi:subtilase family serine protease
MSVFASDKMLDKRQKPLTIKELLARDHPIVLPLAPYPGRALAVPKIFHPRTRPLRWRRTQVSNRFVQLRCEELESRTLLSAKPLLHAVPRRDVADYVTYAPSQILDAYGFNNSIALDIQGTQTSVNLSGAGQTIAIVNAFDAPNIVADLQTFDSQFSGSGLDNFGSYVDNGVPVGNPSPGGPTFSKVAAASAAVSSTGAASSTLPAADAGWSLESSLDVQWAHAVAPGANILLVEAASDSNSDLLAAVGFAKQQPGVSVVSMSWGESEFATEGSFDGTFTAPGVTFVAASGDSGGWAGASWPAISPNVLAVGGTQLTISAGSSTSTSETAWSGSGGGVSAFEAKPAFQDTGSVSTTTRANPDVAFNASSTTPYAVYDSYGQSGLVSVYGTSAGAPQWSGLIARANEGRSLQGQATLANAQAAIYALPASAFNDITSGSNGAFPAQQGFDLVTGRGSPKADVVVSGLIAAASGSTTTTTATASSTTSSSGGQVRHSRGLFGDNADSPGFQAVVTPAQTTNRVNAATPAAVGTNGSSRPLATLAGLGQDNRLNFDPVGMHLQSDATDGGAVPAADPGPVPANDNNNDNED